MQIRLIQPAPTPQLTGASVYDGRIAAALTALGHTVAADKGDVTLIDGFALPDHDGPDLAAATALIHHPLSLENATPDEALMATETRLFHAVRHLVTTSEQTAETLVARFSVPREKITVLVPGIDELPRSPGSGGPTCQVLSIGQIIPRKGHDVLLRALARLFDLDWHLTIVGAGNDPVHVHGLQALTEDLNIGRHVTLAGEVTGDALETIWQSADLFALTPHYEGYGMVFAEALRRGLPVVATDTGAVRSLVVPDAGAICAPGDTDQIAKALRRLIYDKALRHDMAQAAWQSAQNLPSWNDQAAKLAALLAA